MFLFVFFFKQKTAYEMRISDWSSDVCSSDLLCRRGAAPSGTGRQPAPARTTHRHGGGAQPARNPALARAQHAAGPQARPRDALSPAQMAARRRLEGRSRARLRTHAARITLPPHCRQLGGRSEEHTSELQALMRNSYTVFCLK